MNSRGEPSASDLTSLEAEPEFQSILEDLYTEVQLASNDRKRKSKDPAHRGHLPDSAKSVHDLFTLRENWERVGGVALFHDDTQSIIGNFSKYNHRTVKGCWELIREETPVAVSELMHVTGDWWIGLDRKPELAKPWFEDRLAMIKLHLPELGVFAPLVQVRAKLEHQGIMRVELVEETQFADSDGRLLLILPAGTNVLPVMTLDGKINLRQEIGL